MNVKLSTVFTSEELSGTGYFVVALTVDKKLKPSN